MHSAVVGLSWKTASQDVRDRAYIAPEREAQFVAMLREEARVEQILVLSTCNRIEIYLVDPSPEAGAMRSAIWNAQNDLHTLSVDAGGLAGLLRLVAGSTDLNEQERLAFGVLTDHAQKIENEIMAIHDRMGDEIPDQDAMTTANGA